MRLNRRRALSAYNVGLINYIKGQGLMILSFDTFCDEIHHRASRPLSTGLLMTIVTACKEFIFCCILANFWE